jgi:HD-GYP domain-containing protein (c-di-GMP phosphodiesterase class II)
MLFKFIEFVNVMQAKDFSKKTAYKALLKKEARLLLNAKNEKELYTYLIRDLSSWIGLTYAGIFVKDYGEHFYVLKRDFDRDREKKTGEKAQIIFNDKPIIELLKEEKRALRIKDIAESERSIFFREINNLKTKAIVPIFSERELVAFIVLGEKIGKYELTDSDLNLLMSLSKTVGRALSAFLLKREKARLVVAAQNTLINAIEAKDGYTRGHTDRVAFYTVIIAEQMSKKYNINFYGLENLKWSAHLHDVGKIGIPDKILMKPAKLTAEEFAVIKEHPQSGLKIVSSVKEWLGDDVCYGIVQHHENYNGTGYPLGLSGENIHMFSRIIRVADSFDAMTTTRPYKEGLSADEAMDELRRGKGTIYDPDVVEVFEELYKSGRIFGEIQ